MERELGAIYSELKRLRAEGGTSVYLSDDAFSILSKTIASVRARSRQLDEVSLEDLAALKKSTTERPAKKRAAVKEATGPAIPESPSVNLGEGSREEQLASVKEQVLGDSWCQSQVKEGKKVVFGVGSPTADIFFCGEAPGEEEEIQGEPFVGPAGQLLTKIIGAMGLSRDSVYIGNIMNYRPPMPTPVGNRAPTQEEMAYCMPYIEAQIKIVQPKVIVALGKTAVDGLLGPDSQRRMGQIRGKWFKFGEIPLIPTYHPSYLLRNQANSVKRLVWEDMLQVMEKIELSISPKQRAFFSK